MSERDAFGPNLRRIRVQRGISIHEIVAATNVNAALWEGLERNDLSRWPTGIYARALRAQLRKAIGVDPESTVDEFCRCFPQGDRRAEIVIRGHAEIIGHNDLQWRDHVPPAVADGERRARRRGAPPQAPGASAPAAAFRRVLRPPPRAARARPSTRISSPRSDLRPPAASGFGYDRRMRLEAVAAVSRAVAGTVGPAREGRPPGRSAPPRAARRDRDRHRLPERRAAAGADGDRRRAALRRCATCRRLTRRRSSSRGRRGVRSDRGGRPAPDPPSPARSCCASCSARATADEQDFLFRLLFGELRQGALEGVLMDAVARASGIAGAPASAARRCWPAIWRRSRGPRSSKARPALARFVLQPFQPVQPMLADSADDVGGALGGARRGVVRIQARRRAHPGPQGRTTR